ncbi:MAG: GatB/YqeY domain-containing protein [Runella slithyformis]|jgi:uncharacterized protein|nr:MAG: GatB/YqeY domain-containing protein [Runella slithyformis]TAF97429.1 MAG: GatB/YqeY domain-containing protein [Runella sp.]TAG22204.1 MAG: GatB/YqeY domain-containing protein [Cytophagales bacterium]TAG41293.1 MAG: GatB/YqeY domain-containing protein [Cytophagia bacterium]TAF27482.1 MAG: GatB/YqeY domain-containing protein [Runella slithyformis]
MALKLRLDEDIKQAMRAKDADRLRALRALKSMILLEETKEGGTGVLSPDDEMKLLAKAAKQRRDSATIYQEQNRPDLLEKELVEIAVIEEYLPKQLTEEEVKVVLQEIMTRVGAKTPADIGKVMGVAMKELAGKTDGKVVQTLVKTLLS